MSDDITRAVEHRLPTLIDDVYAAAMTPAWSDYYARRLRGEDGVCPLFKILPSGEDTVHQYDTLVRVAALRGYPVTHDREDSDLCTGHTDPIAHVINIDPTHPSIIRANTLAHELAHGVLHPIDEPTTAYEAFKLMMDHERYLRPNEIEAETTAWLVSQSFGLDATVFSVPYLLEYGQGFDGAYKVLTSHKHRTRIIDAASGILSDVRNVLVTS